MADIDYMSGTEFEEWCVSLLTIAGFYDIELTKGSGDQGVDILAWKDNTSYAIQCKRYKNKVGNKAVQEISAGQMYYNCRKAIVITNNYFTPSAIELARATQVILWDRDKIIEEISAWEKAQASLQNRMSAHQKRIPDPPTQAMKDTYNPLYHNKRMVQATSSNSVPPKFQRQQNRKSGAFSFWYVFWIFCVLLIAIIVLKILT